MMRLDLNKIFVQMAAATAALVVISTGVRALGETLCGPLTQKIIKPPCVAGQFCAQYFRIAHMVTQNDREIELQTASYDVLEQLVQATGTNICVDGVLSDQTNLFEVTEIRSSVGPSTP